MTMTRQQALCFTLLLCLTSFASNHAYAAVVELTSENFDDLVSGDTHALVKFYAPWCGHCKRFAPDYDLVGEAFDGNDEVLVGKLNADDERALADRFGVRGYPTVVLFRKGDVPDDNIVRFEEDRTADTLVDWTNERTGAKAYVNHATVLDDETFEATLEETKHLFVTFHAPWCAQCGDVVQKTSQVAKAFEIDDDVVVASLNTEDAPLMKEKLDVVSFPTIKLFNEEHKDGLLFKGERSAQAMLDFINEKTGKNAQLSLSKTDADPIYDAKSTNLKLLSYKNYHKFVMKHEIAFVEFYADWCPKCRSYERDVRKLASKFKDNVPFGVLNADLEGNEDIKEENEITQYPTFKLSVDGRMITYDGEMDFDLIQKWIEKASVTTPPQLNTEDEVNAFIEDNRSRSVVIAMFTDVEEQEEDFDTWRATAKEGRVRDDIVFAEVTSYAVVAAVRKTTKWFKDSPVFLVFAPDKTTDPETLEIDDSTVVSKEGLATWMLRSATPVVAELTTANYPHYSKLMLPMLTAFLNKNKQAQVERYTHMLESVAKKFRGQISFVWMDVNQWSSQMPQLGLTGDTVPAIAFNDLHKRKYAYPEDEKITEEGVEDYCQRFLHGDFENTVKSEKKPEDESFEGFSNFVSLVGDTFDAHVLDKSTDFVVVLTVDDCPSCSGLTSLLKKVARRLAPVDAVKFGVMNVDRNDVPPKLGFKMGKKYVPPVLLIVPATKKTPKFEAFDGSADEDALADWIQRKANNKFKMPEKPTGKSAAEALEEAKRNIQSQFGG